jgi:hypothetical protein
VPVFAIPSPCLLAGVCVFDCVDVDGVVASCDAEQWASVVGMAAEDELQNDVPMAAAVVLVGDAHVAVVATADVVPCDHYVLHAAIGVGVNCPALLLERWSNLPRRREVELADRHRCESCDAAAAEFAASDADNTAGFGCPPDRE